MASIVIYMDAPDYATGRFTKDCPGVAIRMTVADEILEDGLDVFYEILGGDAELRQTLVLEMKKQYQATIKVNQDREDAWRANVCFNNVGALRNVPLFQAFLDHRYDSERLVLVYEDGMAIFRVDLPGKASEPDANRVAKKLR